MPFFECKKCGAGMVGSFAPQTCPVCRGYGLALKDCTCDVETWADQRLNLIRTANPDCPHHGSRAPVRTFVIARI